MSRPKGYKLSLEHKERIRKSIQRKYDEDSEYKKRHAEACRTKEYRQKKRSIGRKYYLNPKNRERLRAQFTPEVRKKMSDFQKKRFQDPKERQKAGLYFKNWYNTLTPKERGEFQSKRVGALRQKGPWNKDLTKETDTRVRKISVAKKGKKRSEETLRKMSEATKKTWANATPEQRAEWNHKNSETHKNMLKDPKVRKVHIARMLKWVKSEEHRKKARRNSKEMWANLSLEKREERLHKIREKMQVKPNRPERFLIPILEPFGFRYTGDRGFFISALERTCIPDFVNKSLKLIVEFDGVYWHNQAKDAERNKIYMENGYRVLSINEDDLALGEENISSLISNFVSDELE